MRELLAFLGLGIAMKYVINLEWREYLVRYVGPFVLLKNM